MKVAIVGAGLAGCTCARLLVDEFDYLGDLEIDMYEAESHIGGLMYDIDGDDIFQHYGPHIFHTSNPDVIEFVMRFAKWKGYCNRPIAITDLGMARLPISIETIADLKGDKLGEYVYDFDKEQDLIYDNIIKGYSKKQWGKPNDDAVKRLKVSETIGGSYFGDVFEGLPEGGFTRFLEKMIDCTNINLYLNKKVVQDDMDLWGKEQKYDWIIWTGPIDEQPYVPFSLKWNGTAFRRIESDVDFLTAVYNYNSESIEFTRATKMCLLTGCRSQDVLLEIPRASSAKHYILEDSKPENFDEILNGLEKKNMLFCGRSATAKYLDMDEVIEQAQTLLENVW